MCVCVCERERERERVRVRVRVRVRERECVVKILSTAHSLLTFVDTRQLVSLQRSPIEWTFVCQFKHVLHHAENTL